MMLFIHVGIVYLLKTVVLARYLHRLCSPLDLEARTVSSYLKHSSWSIAMLAVGFLIANAIPFFSQMLGLIGGLLAGPINFVLPIILYLAALRRHSSCGTVNGRDVVVGAAAVFGAPSSPTDPSTSGEDGAEGAVAQGTSAPGMLELPGPESVCLSSERDDQQLLGYHSPATGSLPAAGSRNTRRAARNFAGGVVSRPPVLSATDVEGGGRHSEATASATSFVGLRSLPCWEVSLMLLITTITLLTMIFGVAAQIKDIIQMEDEFGAPFSCHALNETET